MDLVLLGWSSIVVGAMGAPAAAHSATAFPNPRMCSPEQQRCDRSLSLGQLLRRAPKSASYRCVRSRRRVSVVRLGSAPTDSAWTRGANVVSACCH